tara:strand:+ start:2587 stop:2997 length:411 start_codon:yes stop_codon:yes gene_type:complete
MSIFTGSCLCGSVNYKSNSDPLVIQNCHCDQCRKATGSVYLTNLFIKEENFENTGEVNNYTHLSDAGNNMTKYFCPKCGSQVFGKNSGRPGIITIRAGTVNEKDIIKPIRNLFLKSKVPSTPINSNLEACEGMPLN